MHTNSLSLSIAAANKVATLIQEENNPNLKLRIYITGGGCSGFQYGFSFDEQQQEDDISHIQNCSNGLPPVTLLVDSLSYQYLKDAEIDYTEDLEGQKFAVRNRNPDIKTTCGCGSSFSMDDE